MEIRSWPDETPSSKWKTILLFLNQLLLYWPLFEFFLPLETSVQAWRVANTSKSLARAPWQKSLTNCWWLGQFWPSSSAKLLLWLSTILSFCHFFFFLKFQISWSFRFNKNNMWLTWLARFSATCCSYPGSQQALSMTIRKIIKLRTFEKQHTETAIRHVHNPVTWPRQSWQHQMGAKNRNSINKSMKVANFEPNDV